MQNRKLVSQSAISLVRRSIFIAAFLLLNSNYLLQAQGITDTAPVVKYVGMANDKLLFEVAYQHQAQGSFTLEINDLQGYQFYLEKSSAKQFKKVFAIDKADLVSSSLSFTIATRKNVQKQVFDVNASLRVVEEIYVVKQ